MQEIVYHTNYKLENSYWWFVARNRIVYELINKKCDLAEGVDFLDAGCGTGGFSKILAERYNVVGLDSSELALQYCRKRGLENIYQCNLQEFPHEDWNVKAITMLDVLEHIEDDVSVVKEAYDILPDGGYFVTSVPAYKWLWSRHDLQHMHYRRYTKSQMKNLLAGAGFKIIYSSYFNTLLFLPAALKRLTQKQAFSKDSELDPVDRVPKFLDALFRNIFMAEKAILPSFSFPFGLSIIVIGKK